MACEFTPKGTNNKLTETEAKAYLLDGRLKDFVNSGDVKIKELQDYFAEQKAAAIDESREKGEERTKGIVGRLVESDELPEPLRKRLEKEGVKYNARSQAEADLIAKEIIAQYGETESLDYARSMTFGGDVSSAIFANILNSKRNQEHRMIEADDFDGAFDVADSWAALANEYDQMAREQGRFTSYIQRFYEQSGIGLALKIAKQNAQRLDEQIVAPQQKTFDELLDEIKSNARFQEYINEKVKEALSKTPTKPKETKKDKFVKKVKTFFDKLRTNDDVAYSSIIPVSVWNAAMTIIEQAIIAGATVADAVAKAAKYIGDNVGAFDVKRFENEMTQQVRELVADVEDAEWKKLASRLMPNSAEKGLKIKTDIGKINSYLSRRSNTDRGVVLAALVTKLNDMGIITDAQLQQGFPTEESLSEIIGELTDEQKGELTTFLADRIVTQKSEAARQRALANMEKTLREQIQRLDDQIARGQKDPATPKTRKALPDEIKALIAERDAKAKELDAIDKGIAGLSDEEIAEKRGLEQKKERLKREIDKLREQVDSGIIEEKNRVEYTDAEVRQLESVKKDLQKRLQEIKDANGSTFEQKVRQATKALEKQIARYESLIDQRELTENKKSEPVSTPELEDLRERLKKLKEAYAKMQDDIISTMRPDEAPDWHKQNIINKYLKKLKHMTNEQKQDFVRRSMVSIIANDGLSQEEFRRILGEVMGYSEPTMEERKALEDLAKRINEVDVQQKKLIEANNAYYASQTQENTDALAQAYEDYLSAQADAEKAKFELNEKMFRKANALYTFLSLMQLNTLGATSLLMNASYNLFQLPIKVFEDVFRTGLEHTLSITGRPEFKPTFSLLYGGTSWWGGLGQGFKEGGTTVMTGQQKVDYYEKQMYQTRIRPVEAAKILKRFVADRIRIARGLEPKDILAANMSANEIADKILQAAPSGYHAEAVARGLSLFDKPYRYAAEKAKAAMLARSEFGITNELEQKIFSEMPYEESRRRFYDRFLLEGKSPETAMDMADQKAKAIEIQIGLAGDKGIFTQDNYLAQRIESLMKGSRQGEEGMLGALGQIFLKSNFLFVRIPLNVAWATVNYALPMVAIAQSVYYASMAKWGGSQVTESQKAVYAENAKKWLVHAAVGASVVLPFAMMILPAVTGGDDDDDTPKEQKALQASVPPRSLNISMMNRILFGNKDTKHRPPPEDTYVKLQWFGTFGAILAMRKIISDKETKAGNKVTREGDGLMRGAMGLASTLSTTALYALSSGGFDNMFTMVEALKGSGSNADKMGLYAINLMNVLMNTQQPATFAQSSRAMMDYNYSIADDNFAERIKNNLMARSALARWAMDNEPPAQVTIWGDKAERTKDGVTGYLQWMLGVNQGVKNNFAPEIFNMYEATKDSRLLPTFVQREFTLAGSKVELNYDEWRELQTEVGSARKEMMNTVFGGFFNNISRDGLTAMEYDVMVKFLGEVYKKGGEVGKATFIQKNKDFVIKTVKDYKVTEAQISEALAEAVNRDIIENQEPK